MLKKAPFLNVPTTELAAKGQALLATGTYKEAIEAYKQLLKREQREEWRNALATAYLGRARDLAAKAMYKEATILWENIPALGHQAIQPELYIDWLLRSGQYAKAARAYAQFEGLLQASSAFETLEALLAALALTGHKDIAQVLAVASTLRQHQAFAQAALRAYCQGADEAGLREHLKNIPFRSPYKDFRQVLNALVKLESEPAGALPLLERLTADSPYQDMAAVIRACVSRSASLAQVLAGFSPAQQELAASLLGLDQRRLRLLRQWFEVRSRQSDKTLFDFITNQLPLLEREQARRACLALLPGYPHGLKTYNRLFNPLPPFEMERLQALRAEREQEYHQAVHYWQGCVNLLKQNLHQADHALMAALILRHMVELREHHAPDWEKTATLTLLEESLRLDPDDKASYLKLAELTQKSGDTKAYYQWVDKALKQFPEDSQVLLAAVEAATQRKAFKKAAGFATKLLELDPINSKARMVLINSHLSHARKLIQSGKYALAEKELDSASQLEREGTRNGVVEINRGLLASYLHQQDRLHQQLKEGLRLAGSPLAAQLRLAVECIRLELEPADFLPYLSSSGTRVPDREDIMAVVRIVNAYREEGVADLSWALEDLQAPLKKAVGQIATDEDMQVVCDCLRQAPHYELLEYFATEALKRWKERPLFVYYQILGCTEGRLNKVSDRDYSRLEQAWEQAQAAKDHRATTLIDQFMRQDFPLSPSEFDMPPPPEDFFEGLEEMREALLSAPPELRERLLDQIIKESPPGDLGIPPELAKLLLKGLLLSGDAGSEPPDLFDDMPSPFDFLPPPRPRRKRKKR